MKKLLILTLSIAAPCVCPLSSQAQIVGVQFTSYGAALSSTATAGYGTFAQSNWNSFPGATDPTTGTSLTESGLLSSSGGTTPTGIGFTVTAPDATSDNLDKSADPFPTGTGDPTLAFGELFNAGNDSVTLTINGLTAGANYEVLAYLNTPYFGGTTGASISDGASSLYFATTGSANTSWTPISSTNPMSPSSGNLADFGSVTASVGNSITLTLTNVGANGYSGLSGFQIAPAAAPEPSTYLLLGVGFLGLVVLRKRFARL